MKSTRGIFGCKKTSVQGSKVLNLNRKVLSLFETVNETICYGKKKFHKLDSSKLFAQLENSYITKHGRENKKNSFSNPSKTENFRLKL